MQAALPHDTLLPRAAGGNGPGMALSVLAHAGLAVALTVSVDWRTHTPEVVSAELWASVPQVAAPRAVKPPPPTPAPTPAPAPVQAAPPPPAREADIATERAERRKLEAEAEQKKRQQAEADAKKRQQAEQAARDEKAREEEARVARQREENLRRMMSQAGGSTGSSTASSTTSTSGGTGTAAQDAAPSAAYAGRIVAAVRKNITFTGAINDESSAEVEVRAAPGGTIISSRLLKASGHKDWDEAVLRALDKTGRLPTDTDGRVPSKLILVFRPREQ